MSCFLFQICVKDKTPLSFNFKAYSELNRENCF